MGKTVKKDGYKDKVALAVTQKYLGKYYWVRTINTYRIGQFQSRNHGLDGTNFFLAE